MSEDDEEDSPPPECNDCHTVAPRTRTSYSLIGEQHGWRLSRGRAADGTYTLTWRCPSCWEKHKQAGGT